MKINVEKVWVDDTSVNIRTTSGETKSLPIAEFHRLGFATSEQRQNFETDVFGIHWPDIDEDLNFESFFQEEKAKETALSKTLKSFPEINVSALARRIGISQSLMAQYISGIKNLSEQRRVKIETALHGLGKELLSVNLINY